jgi:hypothetical protein
LNLIVAAAVTFFFPTVHATIQSFITPCGTSCSLACYQSLSTVISCRVAAVCGRQDFATQLEADDNRSATKAPDIITVGGCSVVVTLHTL